ncbi:MAG: hypothetical protein LC746_04650 [Acidobacteria bacterium]|nr:hypothetical protein [Acidobacteriota bacterium]
MRVCYRTVLCCAFCLLAFSAASAQRRPQSKPFHTEGVFSNIAATEGGDYAGMRVYLTDSDGQFYAAVTVAEGVLLPPVLVKVKAQVEQRKIEFEIPSGDSTRKFTGTVTADALTLVEGGNKIVLKRKCDD